MAGTSSPSANSRMMVPETGDVLSSSKANFREAFLRGAILVFFGLALFGDSGEDLLTPNGFRGGDPRPTLFRVRSNPGILGGSPTMGIPAFAGGEVRAEFEAAATAALANNCCCRNSGEMGLVEPFIDKWFW